MLSDNKELLTLSDTLSYFWNNENIFIVVLGIFSMSGIFYSLSLANEYESEAIFVDGQAGSGGIADGSALSSLSTRLDTTHALLSSARHSSMNRTRLSSMISSGGRGLPRSSRSGATRSTTEPLGSSNRGRAGGPQHRTFSSAQAKTSRGSSLRAPCRGTVLAV